MALDPAILGDMYARLRECETRSSRGDVLTYYARLTSVSVAQLRRLAKANGVAFGYSRRIDAGQARKAQLAAAADRVASLIVKSQGDMPTWVAIDRAKTIGLIEPDIDIAPHYVDRYMRSRGIERSEAKGPVTTRRIKWGLPGEVMQIDSTNCQQWFFVEADGRIRYTERGEVYRNKPAKCPPIIRYVASDPTSGCFRVRYYQTDGESAEVTLDFLHWAMSRAPDPDKMPMAGTPKTLVVDRGPGNMSAAVGNICAELGIERRPHSPGRSNAKGSVEETMWLWQQAFESELRVWPASSLEELNERAYLANCKFCLTREHTRTGMPRSVFYAEHVGAIVLPPPWEQFVEAAVTKRETRVVKGGGPIISYEGRDYYVGGLPGVKVGSTVEVAKAVLAWDADTRPVRIWFGDACAVEQALVGDGRGNYTDARLYRERHDAVLEQAAQERAARIAEPVPSAAPRAELASVPSVEVPQARMVVRPAQPQPVKRRTVAMLELSDRVGRELTVFEVNSLGWGDGVAQAQIDAAVAALTSPRSADGGAAMRA